MLVAYLEEMVKICQETRVAEEAYWVVEAKVRKKVELK